MDTADRRGVIPSDLRGLRERMVRDQIESRGISDPGVLGALTEVPRHRFVEAALESAAYGDHALPIGHGQTISQPYIVALMTEGLNLSASSRVLEIGTGSGYQTAVLARLCKVVFTIERIPALALRAQRVLRELGIENVVSRIGDGTLGWRRFAPFDGILVAAGAPEPPPSLLDQLALAARLVVPAGTRASQHLIVLERAPDGEVRRLSSVPCTFVPLIGREGWTAGDARGS